MQPQSFSFEEIKVGQTASFSRTWNEKDIQVFSEVSGDLNPLHMDSTYAETTQFKKRVIHGMLNASLFSTLVGMYLPGKHCLYLSQSLIFKKPVYIHDTVTVAGTVLSKSEATKVIILSTTITRDEEIVVEGEARVQILL